MFDLAAASFALTILAPLLVIVALAIKIDSPGPIIFRQRRSGFRGRAFRVLKFRTMRQMDDGASIVQAVSGDPRVTRIGRFLRRTSIDELPQLINVVAGDMSLIGPRPHALAHDNAFWIVDGRYPARFYARPGVSGLAQVCGSRGLSETNRKVEERMNYDLQYVTNWSWLLDLKILVRTLRVVISDPNAV